MKYRLTRAGFREMANKMDVLRREMERMLSALETAPGDDSFARTVAELASGPLCDAIGKMKETAAALYH